MLTRLVGTGETARSADDGRNAKCQISETLETWKTHVVLLITQRAQDQIRLSLEPVPETGDPVAMADHSLLLAGIDDKSL